MALRGWTASRAARRFAAPALLALLTAGAFGACSTSPREEPTLRVLMGADVTTLDPHTSFDEVTSAVIGNLYEPLVQFDQALRLGPRLATRWINPDDRTWRFFLSDAARFPDGSPLRAGDVKFSLERLRSLENSQLTGFVRHVTSVDVVDELTVDVRTDAPSAVLNGLAFIPILSERQARAGAARLAEEPFGTGPYKLAKWEKGKSIVLEANPHRPLQPPIRRVEFLLRPNGVSVDEVLAVKPHVTLYLPRTAIEDARTRLPPELKLVTADGLAVYYLVFNTQPVVTGDTGPNPLHDVRVRRALALATDREALVGHLHGYGPAAQLVVPQVFGFDPARPPARYDPTEARRLLAEAGVPDLKISFDVTGNTSRVLASLLQRQWAAAGVAVATQERDPAQSTSRLETGGFQVALQGYGCTSGDASEMLTFCLRTRQRDRGLGPGNYSGYSNAEIDRIADENLRQVDPRKRLVLLQRALALALDDAPYLPLLSAKDVYILGGGLRWSPPVHAEFRAEDVSFTTR